MLSSWSSGDHFLGGRPFLLVRLEVTFPSYLDISTTSDGRRIHALCDGGGDGAIP